MRTQSNTGLLLLSTRFLLVQLLLQARALASLCDCSCARGLLASTRAIARAHVAAGAIFNSIHIVDMSAQKRKSTMPEPTSPDTTGEDPPRIRDITACVTIKKQMKYDVIYTGSSKRY